MISASSLSCWPLTLMSQILKSPARSCCRKREDMLVVCIWRREFAWWRERELGMYLGLVFGVPHDRHSGCLAGVSG